jgi:hypothetical protein
VYVTDAELKKCVRGEPMPPIGEWVPSAVH